MKTSLQRRSIRWLCIGNPAIMLPLFKPLCCSVALPTSTFLPPLSERTLEGHPQLCTAAKKKASTVAAELFIAQLKYTISLENPSMPPCITNVQRIRQCSPSMCQRELGPQTL